jgi:MFS family permease
VIAARARFGALGERRFRLLWFGQAGSQFGNALMPIALAFAVIHMTGEPSDLGFVLAAPLVPHVALLLVGGVWADRLPRQAVMLASDLLRAVSQGAFALLYLTGNAELWQLLVCAFVYGVAQAFFNPALTGLVPETVSAGRLQEANALIALTRNVLNVVGPAVAGVIVAVSNPGWLFAADAATFLVSAVFLAQLGVRGRLPARGGRFVSEVAHGWRELTARSWVWSSVAFYAVANFAWAPVWVLGPLVAARDLGGADAWGIVLGCAGVGPIVGSAVVLRLRPSRPLLAGYAALATLAVVPALLVRPFPVAVIALAAAVAMACLTFSNALWSTALQQHVPRHALSRVSAYDYMGSYIFTPLGYALAGIVAGEIGLEATLWALAAVLLLATAAVLAVPSVRRLTRDRVPELAPPAAARALPE